MDNKEVLEKALRYAVLVRTLINPKKVILYGSHSKGTAHDESDIDIAVICDRIDGDYLEQSAKLYKLRRNIDTRIEPILLEEGNDESGFVEEVLKTGTVIYNRT